MIDLSDFATSPIILKSSFAMFKPGEGKLKILIVSKWVKTISKGRLDSIPSPSPSVKIQIMDGEVCLRCKGKILLGIVKKLLKTKSLLTSMTSPSKVLPYYLK